MESHQLKAEGPEPDATLLIDHYQSLAEQQGVFVKRDGNTLWTSGPIEMGESALADCSS